MGMVVLRLIRFMVAESNTYVFRSMKIYNTGEYVGELYRMKISCSGGGLPESGCLFFEVAGNTSTMIGIHQLIVVIAMPI